MNRAISNLTDLEEWGKGKLPDLIGFKVTEFSHGRLLARMRVRDQLLAPNGYLHAAAVVALADTACGYGTMIDLPADAKGFTTVELKTNFVGTCLSGVLRCEAIRAHHGRTTQVWDATVIAEETEKTIALFRCTQIVLYGRP